ncbi:hypothetical protein BX661DRAFT_200700 [Kickxella alabastrina]|uniref:uncharacterized protein n=1 Tax=Kickxella alabastrina TaxID=61397 RepID=UPI00221F9AF1|nr:uncharacterized protein BX661DRAFT_200700 [Kickxella alabastrina]KAI7821462.1 hypothetical protein BX661DRAFT_200700 [Kickxella alabastrina]
MCINAANMVSSNVVAINEHSSIYTSLHINRFQLATYSRCRAITIVHLVVHNLDNSIQLKFDIPYHKEGKDTPMTRDFRPGHFVSDNSIDYRLIVQSETSFSAFGCIGNSDWEIVEGTSDYPETSDVLAANFNQNIPEYPKLLLYSGACVPMSHGPPASLEPLWVLAYLHVSLGCCRKYGPLGLHDRYYTAKCELFFNHVHNGQTAKLIFSEYQARQ